MDKTRQFLAGKLSFTYRAAFCSPMGVDGFFLKHFGLSSGNLIRAVRSSPDDEALAAWFLAQPTVTPEAIAAWNDFAPTLGAKGRPGRFVFQIVRPFFYANAKSTDSMFEAVTRDETT
ncbi:hypothetical protein AYO41_00080 [Verrucomicrobia bacterium SCGC AG-212-E04]|nr:hypothetical protein AYO41_00080 [Verrucomicrobia bacterium SCGC AG-212-E04]